MLLNTPSQAQITFSHDLFYPAKVQISIFRLKLYKNKLFIGKPHIQILRSISIYTLLLVM